MPLCDLQRVQRSGRAHTQRFDAQPHVVHGARRRGKVEDVLDLPYVEGLADIDLLKAKLRLAVKMAQIREVPRREVVDAHDLATFSQQRVTQVRSQKPGRTRYQNSRQI